jgi:hypothetical protein
MGFTALPFVFTLTSATATLHGLFKLFIFVLYCRVYCRGLLSAFSE